MQTQTVSTSLEEYFEPFRENILGASDTCRTHYGEFPVVYADWIAEGRLYGPIEEILSQKLGPYVANPHSYSSYTGQNISEAYRIARQIIRRHVNASSTDILVTTGHGMTGALQRFIQILDLKFNFAENKPAVFITHMEHHSNHTTWQQSGADVFVIPPDENGLPDPAELEKLLSENESRKIKIGSFTASSNVTGIITPYHKLAGIMHKAGGFCFIDFAASAPYVEIDMHPENDDERLDAVFFAPHKFLGGPGSCGILVFGESLHSGIPSLSGGGNVKWTQPGGSFGYSKDIETQEDGGTPAYLQTIRTSLAIRLKENMGVGNIKARERELMDIAIPRMKQFEGCELLGCENDDLPKIGAISFNIKGLHYNLVVRLLNDRFGIQTRGGWSCASTYGHYLFQLTKEESDALVSRIDSGDFTGKPGWVRISLHPTMTNESLEYCLNAIEEICRNGGEWASDYAYDSSDNEYYPVNPEHKPSHNVMSLFEF